MSSKSKRKKRRQRRPATAAPAQAVAQPKPKPRPAAARRPQPADERPPAPWGSFPLVEIAVLVGIVMLVLAFVVGGERQGILLATGLALASLAGLELSIREHFAGFRSHSMLLAGVAAIVVLGILFYAGPDALPPVARLAMGAAVFAGGFWLLSRAFRNRAGVAIKLR